MGIPIGPFPDHQIEIRVAKEFAGYRDLLAFTANLRGEGDASNEILPDRPRRQRGIRFYTGSQLLE
jgi:hypothetical protein